MFETIELSSEPMFIKPVGFKCLQLLLMKSYVVATFAGSRPLFSTFVKLILYGLLGKAFIVKLLTIFSACIDLNHDIQRGNIFLLASLL